MPICPGTPTLPPTCPRSRAARAERERECWLPCLRAPMDAVAHMAGSSASVESGQPIVDHGEAHLGPLSFACDGTIAGQIWGAGAALGRHLMLCGLPERPEVLEIGSGTGVAGLAAATAGAKRVVLTDRADVVARLAAAIEHNATVVGGSECSAAALEWGDDEAAHAAAGESGVDLVLAADVLYTTEPAVHEALRATLIALARPRDATIWHCYEERWPAIVAQWRDGVRDCAQLRLVSEQNLDAPPAIRDGRRLVLEELRLTEDGLYS